MMRCHPFHSERVPDSYKMLVEPLLNVVEIDVCRETFLTYRILCAQSLGKVIICLGKASSSGKIYACDPQRFTSSLRGCQRRSSPMYVST